MIQTRCSGCGYLQTLSEERFLAIQEDYLICPHCHEKIPKTWSPAGEAEMSDEAKHKMLAFSRRILNGAEITREIVHALETQMRQHGPIPECLKALGLGYAQLGEANKAEEFLVEAWRAEPMDTDIQHSLLMLFNRENRFRDAVEIGEALVLKSDRPDDMDVAQLALAYLGSGTPEKAKLLMDKFPELDPHNSAVKLVNKKMNKLNRKSFADFIKQNSVLSKLVPTMEHPQPEQQEPEEATEQDRIVLVDRKSVKQKQFKKQTSLFEYWVYALDPAIPNWEDIRKHLATAGRKEDRNQMFSFLESSIKSNELSIDYIMRTEAPTFFEYPEELIEPNAKEFNEDDKSALLNAAMIVRIKYKPAREFPLKTVSYVIQLVESIRAAKSGIVQDAGSHILWGTAAWEKYCSDPSANFVENHIHCEILDEGKTVWMHTHGLHKFGYPELELDHIDPTEMRSAKRILFRTAYQIIQNRKSGLNFSVPMQLTGTPVTIEFALKGPDPEKHFPLGSFALTATIEDDVEQDEMDTPQPEVVVQVETENVSGDIRKDELKIILLKAHDQAKAKMPYFKKSFAERKGTHQIHAVKVGFPAPNGEPEWMWVSLEAWRGRAIYGYLENVPVLRNDLRKGCRVQIDENDVFDWVISQGGTIVKGAFTEQYGRVGT